MHTQEADLKVNQDLYNRTIAVAPFDGIVTNEPPREGEMVVTGIQNTEGSTLMTIADMSVVTADVKVDETDIVNVQLGQPAEVTVDALPNKVFKGHVTEVGDQALLRSTGVATSQSTTGTEEAKDFRVVVTLDVEPSTIFVPALSCTAKITTAHKTDVLALPIQALTMHDPATDNAKPGEIQASSTNSKTNPIQGVFIVHKDDHGKLRANFVPVTTGITGATDIEVLSGVNNGDEIVTGPYKTLRDLFSKGALIKRGISPVPIVFHPPHQLQLISLDLPPGRLLNFRIEDESQMALNSIGIEELFPHNSGRQRQRRNRRRRPLPWRTYDMGSEATGPGPARRLAAHSTLMSMWPSWAHARIRQGHADESHRLPRYHPLKE